MPIGLGLCERFFVYFCYLVSVYVAVSSVCSWCVYFLNCRQFVLVNSSAVHCLKSFVCNMTCYVASGMLNSRCFCWRKAKNSQKVFGCKRCSARN